MYKEQYDGLIAALSRIEHRLPEPAGARTAGQRQALIAVLNALNGWIGGMKSNHAALEHRDEIVGEECWNTFHSSDVMFMIDDAARALGIADLYS